MKLPVNLFDLAYLAILPPAAAAVRYKMWRHGKYLESAPALMGAQLRADEAEQSDLWRNGCVWVHAVSVGEVIAARAMLPLLRERFAPLPILLTTHTETGQATARALPAGLVDVVRYYPLDFSWLMRRAVKVYRPKVFIPMETELWPNALQVLSESGTKIFTINGKISPKSFKSYQKIRPLIRRPLECITAFCAQTEADAARIGALLGRSDNIHVTGNCKFDVQIPVLDENEKAGLAAELGLPWPCQLIVAGSTHPGEETIVLDAFQEVLQHFPQAQLAIVPRHPERFDEVWALLAPLRAKARRVSDGPKPAGNSPNVHLVDRMGLLTRLYGLAEVAVVAGSFTAGIGGHNLLEPAAHTVPVVYGPDMKGQPDMLRIMRDSGAGTQVDAPALGAALVHLLQDKATAQSKGMAGQRAVQANQGSAKRNMEVIEMYLDESR